MDKINTLLTISKCIAIINGLNMHTQSVQHVNVTLPPYYHLSVTFIQSHAFQN